MRRLLLSTERGKVMTLANEAGLEVYDIDELPMHGGSLRIYVSHWDLRKEIMEQRSFTHAWGGKFVVPIPEIRFDR